jgi:hypothetical protein
VVINRIFPPVFAGGDFYNYFSGLSSVSLRLKFNGKKSKFSHANLFTKFQKSGSSTAGMILNSEVLGIGLKNQGTILPFIFWTKNTPARV